LKNTWKRKRREFVERNRIRTLQETNEIRDEKSKKIGAI